MQKTRAKRTAGWTVLLATACAIPKVVGEPDTDGDTDPGATSEDPSATDSASSQSASASATDDGADADTGDEPGGQYVDCATISADDETIAGGELSPLGFPVLACNPRASGEASHKCCSSDPATADGQLPAYEGKGITGSEPLYAGAVNYAGTWGMCVNTTDIPAGFGLLEDAAENCPIPCNPTWSANDVANVCGAGRVCCQTIELGPKDCVQDEDGTWRAVRGTDIGSDLIEPRTNWNAVAHDTHQDPNGTVCLKYAKGDPATAEFQECIKYLNVADQRGFCMGLGPGQACAAAVPSYVDVCEAMNG
jgi:hypothetical protein